MRAREVAGPIEFPPRAECRKVSLPGHLTSKNPGGNDAPLVALDAASGHLCADFGTGGETNLRAFDIQTGKLLWTGDLPAVGNATPMTYEAAGVQYVVIAAGGQAKFDSKRSDSIVAFALP